MDAIEPKIDDIEVLMQMLSKSLQQRKYAILGQGLRFAAYLKLLRTALDF